MLCVFIVYFLYVSIASIRYIYGLYHCAAYVKQCGRVQVQYTVSIYVAASIIKCYTHVQIPYRYVLITLHVVAVAGE